MLQSSMPQYITKELRIHEKMLSNCDWSPDGKYLGACFTDKQVKICQLEFSGTLRVIQTLPCGHSVRQVVWNPIDNQRFAIIGMDKVIELWDVRAPRATSKIPCLNDNVDASWSPNGEYIVTANYQNQLCVFDTKEGKLIKKANLLYELNQVSWTANSDHILCATEGISRFGEMEIIAFKDHELRIVDSMQAHSGTCEKLVIDNGYSRVALSSIDQTVSLWDLDDLICSGTIQCDCAIEGLSFSGDGRHIAVGLGGPNMIVCDSITGETVVRVDVRFHSRAVAWHPTQDIIALGVEDKGGAPTSMRLISFPMGL